MDVLRKVHGTLRPRGVLLDIHPEPVAATVEVQRQSGCTLQVGHIDESSLIGRIHATRAALATLVDAGAFVLERAETFEFLAHFDSVDAWLAYRAEQDSTGVVDDAVVARARELLASEPGELRVRDYVYAGRLRRV